MITTFKDKWTTAKSRCYRPKLYNRQEVHKLLGFHKSVLLTVWLRENYFITYDDYPCEYVLDRDLMESHTRVRKHSGISDRVPLFTQTGIDFFGRLRNDPTELKRVCDEIINEINHYSIPVY